MADIAQPVGISKQITLIAGLRWRMLHNFLRRKQNRLDLIGVIILGVVVCVFVIGVCFALFAGAYEFVSSGRIAWLGFFFWRVLHHWAGVRIGGLYGPGGRLLDYCHPLWSGGGQPRPAAGVAPDVRSI